MSLGGKLVRAWVALIAIAALFGALASAGAAKGGGQLESWGTKGTAEGQFFNPGMMGVDPSTGTVYTGDLSADKKNFRLQQFSPTGELKAVGTTPRFSGEALLFMHGIAVDPVLERFYVIEGCRVTVGQLTPCKKTGGVFGAKQILVFSTKPEGGKLVADKTTPTIPLPSGENELYLPESIAVDPSTHDLVVFAEDATHHPVVERFSSAGVPGSRFVDNEKKLRPSGAENPVATKDATSVVVSPAGVSYAMTGNQLIDGATRAWQLPPTLANVEPVPGFAAAAESESWAAPMAGKPESTIGGNQIAISTDGSTLYWKEMATESEPAEAGVMLVRGFSLTSNATVSLWGEGTSSCKITTTSAGMAAAPGNKLVAFDYGPISDSPPYGVKVLTFGPGGTGCPEPKAKFTVNGKKEGEEPTGIKPGDTVSFDAASSEVFGGFRRELIWKFGDGTEKVVKFTPGLEGEADKEAVTTVSHLYSSTAKVTVRLEIKLTNANLGSPDPVERSFNVGTPAAGQKLTVTKSGTGTGTVTSSPSGINCGAICEAEFETGKEVTLTPVATAGSEFKGWSGACSGTGACKVTMSAAKSVGAQFGLIPEFKLKVVKSGTGSGTVTSVPFGINCGVACEVEFEEGTVVTLSASPDPGSQFSGWSGAGCSGTGSCEVTMSAAKEVTASFAAEPHLLTVTKSGIGAGTVTSSPAGINCGSTCSASFAHNVEVTLAPTPAAGSEFKGWSGACSGTGTCKVTMSAAKSVGAEFALMPTFKLTVTKSGTGTGTVTSSPSGINCGAICEAEFETGKEVTLTPVATAGSEFKGWSGACTGTGACKVTMSAAKTVGTEFALEQHLLTVSKTGTGSGTATSTPAGINCGATCSASFTHNVEVTLTPAASPGSEFKGWSGACSGAGTCKVTMSAAKSVTAEFALEQHLLTVSKTGTGSGTATSTPAGINCGATCSASFTHNVEVTLTPAASPGSEFKGWSGACSGTGTCKVTMSATKSVGAEFALEQRLLTVNKSGSGGGTVSSSPAGIDCGSTCEALFNLGTEVTLTPTPAAGSEFKGWSGACSGTGTCKVTMSAAKSVGAEFALIPGQVLLTVNKAGNGSGTVTSTPAGINCGSTCEAGFTEGTSVTLQGVAGANTKAVVWSGCTEIVGSNECKVAISAAKEVSATLTLEKHTLTVTKSGTGSDTVTSNPAGINCGATCSAEFNGGEEVELTPAPGAGSKFVKWTGSCTGSGACKVTISAAKSVTAEFALIPNFKLKAIKAGTGSGTVTSNPAGINCGPTCEAEYEEGKVVTLSAAPAAGSQFSGWSGAGCSGTGSCEVTMSAAKEVTATFTLEQHTLTVTESGTGAGSVTSSPAGISCGATCSASFAHNVEVTLIPTPAAGSEFKGWSGACSGTGTCKVTISAAKSAGAEFALIPGHFQLKAIKAGTGSGTVTSNPAGINCGPTCEAEYEEGQAVTLTAAPAAGSQFSGWSGAGCSGTGTCEVTMSAAKEVTATFTLEQHTLTVATAGTGSGSLASSPAGIECGSTCAAGFDHGTEVTLTPTPAAGSEFKGWGGACSGSGACKVTVDAVKEVTATFDLAATPPPAEKPVETPTQSASGELGPRFSNNGPGGGNKLEMPVTIAGPSSDIVDFGGVAMAPDASGGAVYTRTVEGVPHVFANRYADGSWSAPIRVDGDLPYEGTQPRIAAGRKGELLVVWVSQVATVEKEIRYALYSAKLGRGATEFGPSQLVDPNVCRGIGVDPSLSGTAPSQAIVAYRVVTWIFDGNKYCGNQLTTAVQTRPGDVMAEIRVARLKEDRWARLGAMNNNPEASMRPPSAGNGPQVGAGVDGGAVVAWQEPDQTGTARILMRRIFGTVPGQILQASPSSLDGTPVSGDVDAFSLAVTPLDQARIAMRVQPNSSGGRSRLLLNTLPAGYVVPSNALLGAQPVFTAEGGGPGAIGPPGVAAYEKGGKEGQLRLAFVNGTEARQMAVDKNGALIAVSAPAGPAAVPGAESVAAIDPDGGGVVAYPASANGSQALAVRQEFPNGAAQTGLLSGLQDGPIAQLGIGDSGSGDALIGFRQGEPGRFQVVVERVSARPSSFKVKGPKEWTKPSQVKLSWGASQSNAGRVTYSVLVGGRIVTRGLRKLSFRLRPATLGTGRRQARVLATDGVGQQLLSKKVKLLIDGEAPVTDVSGRGGGVTVRVGDPDSGVKLKKTWVSFGDGSTATDGSRFRHSYERAGRYAVVVHASDRAGNRVVRRFEVRAR